MLHTQQIRARADARPTPFACTATHGGLDAAWIYLAGELDITTAPALQRTLHETQQHAQLTVLDLRELTFSDCAGMHTIVNASLQARNTGRRLIIVRGRPDIYRMFTLTNSIAHLDIADLKPAQPPPHTQQRTLVAQSLLKTGKRHREPSH